MSSGEHQALEAGLKPAVRLLVRAAERERAIERWRGVGAIVERPGPDDRILVYVSRDRARAEAIADAEAEIYVLRDRPPTAALFEAHRILGRGLGYPTCCVDAFVARVERSVTRLPDGTSAHEDYVATVDALSRTEILHARLNVLRRRERMSLISHYPCRFDCPPSLAYAASVFEMLDRRSQEKLRVALAAPLTIDRSGQVGSEGAHDSRSAPLALRFERF